VAGWRIVKLSVAVPDVPTCTFLATKVLMLFL
jgi:hypothetical protein